METTIEQQVAMDEALIPSAQRCPFYKAFLVTTDVLEIYMQEFWATDNVHQHSIRFKMDNKKHILELESFRNILHICPRVQGQSFAKLPFEEKILDFIRFLGHSVTIRTLTDSSPILSSNLVGAIPQAECRPCFPDMDLSIPRRNKVNWHYVRDDFMFSMIKLVSRHQNTQQFDALMPIELTNEEIRNSKAYKEYYAIATREAAPKPKASVRRTRSGSDTSITSPTAIATPRPTAAATLRLTSAIKGKQTAKEPKAKSLSAPSEPGGFGIDEGTGSKPGVPDVPTDESEEELSWNSSDDEGSDDQEKVGDDDERDEDNDHEEGEEDDGDEDKDGDERNDNDEDQEVVKNDDLDDAERSRDDDEEGGSNNEEDQGLNIGKEERLNEEEEADELYRDVDINQGRGLQVTQEVEDSRVTLTSVNPDGMESIFETASTSVAPLPVTTPTMTPSTIITTSQAPTLPTPIPSEVLQNLPNFTSVFRFDDRLRSLEQNFSEVMQTNQFADAQRNLYKALVDAYESDKIILDTYEETVTLKIRRDDDEDKDEEPSAGPDRGSKRRREDGRALYLEFEIGADDQPIVQSSQHSEWFSEPKKPPSPDRDWNKTLPAVHRSIQPWISELAKQDDTRSSFNELMDTPLDFSNFIMNRLRVDTLTLELLAGPTYDLTKVADYGHIKWIEDLVPRTMWMQEPIDYDKHALWGVSHWGRKRQQFYGFAVNQESARDVYSNRRIIVVTELKIVEWHSYKHLDWITVRRDDDKLYKFKEGDFKRLRIQDIKDMLLLLVQGKLTNLTVKERFAFNVSLRMFTRSIVIQRRVEDLQLGVESYQKKLNLTKPDTYRSDLKRKEAYNAYSNPRDGTLIDVRTALDDYLKGIQMQYLPQIIWRRSDKDRAAAMIQAIDKRLKTRRVMRSLERFVGGRLYEGDFRMLQRTI
nr:hypothetical protein [Tanacetum cinerariifolium]